MSTWSSTCRQRYLGLSDIRVTNISKSFTHKMAAETNWHRYGTKLRHCHVWHLHKVIALLLSRLSTTVTHMCGRSMLTIGESRAWQWSVNVVQTLGINVLRLHRTVVYNIYNPFRESTKTHSKSTTQLHFVNRAKKKQQYYNFHQQAITIMSSSSKACGHRRFWPISLSGPLK